VHDSRVKEALALSANGSISIAIPFGPPEGQQCDLYDVSLRVLAADGTPSGVLEQRLCSVVAASLAHTGAEVLIGTDLLRTCRFSYDGPNELISLET
jgi:hypothetical protein